MRFVERGTSTPLVFQNTGTPVRLFRLIPYRWEHSPHWSQTSKLLISKHQQVQLLEAAQILVYMNRSDSSLSTQSAGDRFKVEGYNYPVVFEDEDDMMDVQSNEGQKRQEEDEEMFGMDE